MKLIDSLQSEYKKSIMKSKQQKAMEYGSSDDNISNQQGMKLVDHENSNNKDDNDNDNYVISSSPLVRYTIYEQCGMDIDQKQQSASKVAAVSPSTENEKYPDNNSWMVDHNCWDIAYNNTPELWEWMFSQ